MRRRTQLLASLLALAVPLAGCAREPGSGPAPVGDDIVAFLDAPEPQGPNRTLLVLRDGGAADRLTYLADGSWLPRLAPRLEYPRDDLALLFERHGSVERGGLVLRIERGSVPEPDREGLRPFLDGEWPAPVVPPGEPHPWYRPMLAVRVEPRPAATEAPPDMSGGTPTADARLDDLLAAFARANASFVVQSAQDASLPFAQPWDGCLRASTSASPAAARVGDDITVRVQLANCGGDPVTLDPRACDQPPTAHVQLSGSASMMLAALPSSEAPSAAYALDLACRGDAPAVELPAGGTVELTRRWNGTLAACLAPDRCAFRPAPSGQYHLFTYATGQSEASPAVVTLLADDAPVKPLLLVREYDWANTTDDAHILGHFGPHCAPVAYTTDPTTAMLWYYETKPALGDALVVRDWRDGPRPPNVATVSADRLDVDLMADGNATLASPFDPAVALAEVRLDADGAFLVDGQRLAPGATLTLRDEREITTRDGAFRVTSVLVLEHLGDASIVWQRAGGCA